MRILKTLLCILFFCLPFQKQISKPFDGLSKRLIPEGLVIPPFFYKQIFFYPSDILILLFVAITLYFARSRLKEFFFAGPSKYLLALLLFSLLSIVFASSPHYVVHYYRLLQLSVFVLFFLALKFFLQNTNTSSFLRTFFTVVLASSLLQTGFAFSQLLLKSSLGLKFLGEENVLLFAFLRQGNNILAMRPSGTFTHPNVLGGFLFFALLSTFYLLVAESHKLKKILFSVALLIQTAGLIATLSRSAIFAYILGMSAFLFLSIRANLLTFKTVSKAFAPIVIGIAASLILFYPQIKAKGGFLNYNTLAKNCDNERVIYQKVAYQMYQEHPLLGIGFNHFQLTSPAYQPKDYTPTLYSKVHNVFLLILAETGILGFSAFILFLLATVGLCPIERFLHRGKPSSPPDLLSILMLSLFIGFIFISGCDFYLWDLQHGRLLFLGNLALLVAYNQRINEKKLSMNKKNRLCL